MFVGHFASFLPVSPWVILFQCFGIQFMHLIVCEEVGITIAELLILVLLFVVRLVNYNNRLVFIGSSGKSYGEMG